MSAREQRPDTIEGEVGLPSVNARPRSSASRGLALLFIGFIALAGAGVGYFWLMKGRKAEEAQEPARAERIVNAAPARTFGATPPPPKEIPQERLAESEVPPPAEAQVHNIPAPETGEAQAPATIKPKARLDKSASSLMVTDSGSGRASAQPAPEPSRSQPRNALSDLLEGSSNQSAQAGWLGNRNLMLALGATIECSLETRLDTTVPGMASCLVTRDVYSDNGKVVLIERGSKATGEYSTGLQQGMNRIFVLWTRIKTPRGVVIDIDSPGADALGASGLGGKVNNHFWKRFGAAMMLSLIDDTAAAITRETKGDGNTISYGNSANSAEAMASKVLETTVNIPPTLYKKHGDRISIFVARDLDFGQVYGLSAE